MHQKLEHRTLLISLVVRACRSQRPGTNLTRLAVIGPVLIKRGGLHILLVIIDAAISMHGLVVRRTVWLFFSHCTGCNLIK